MKIQGEALSIPITCEEDMVMSLFRLLCVCAVMATLGGCASGKITPNYTSTNPDLLRIGGDKPADPGEPEIINMGSYCLQVVDKWKTDGDTPDNQKIWTKDTFRKVVPCR